MTCKEISEYYTKQGKKVSDSTVYTGLKHYKKQQQKKKSLLLDDKVKEILLSGKSVKDYCIQEKCQEQESDIRERIRRLKVIAEHARKQGDSWVSDINFIEIIRVLESIGNLYPGNKYLIYLRPYISGGICKNGNISTIERNVFKNNKDLMVYILSSYHLKYGEEYDLKVWNKFKKEYEAKIDKYFTRLHTLEEKAENKSKEKNNSDTKKKGTKSPNQGDQR